MFVVKEAMLQPDQARLLDRVCSGPLIHISDLHAHNALAGRLQAVGEVTRNQFLLRLRVAPHEITVFPDARAIIAGTDDPAEAKTLYAKYVGS